MQGFALLSFVAALIAGTAVGVRLLALARATHRLEELTLGIAVVLLVIAGGLEVTGLELARANRLDLAFPVEAVALFTHSACATSLCLATWRVFFPDRPWALRLCLVEITLLFTSWQAIILFGKHTSVTGFTPWFHLHVAARCAAFAWSAIAAFGYHRQLRRRLKLGLAEPFLCHRFLLWAISMGASTGMLATALVTNITLGVLVFVVPTSLLLVSVLGLVSAWGLAFAFLPPAAYVRFVESSAARS